ncbi:MAG: phage major capsid protein [Actinobacteria bacterium]|nr:phage major capsid protein [Actinomycetota bacterium]
MEHNVTSADNYGDAPRQKTKEDLRVGASFTEPDAIVIHPTNLMNIATAKDADGRYLVADPAVRGPESLLGMRVVATTEITLNTALMGNLPRRRASTCASAPRLSSHLSEVARPSSSAT